MHIDIVASTPTRPTAFRATLTWELRNVFAGSDVEIHCPTLPDKHRILSVNVDGGRNAAHAKELAEDLRVMVDLIRQWVLEDAIGVRPRGPEAA